jgi:Baculovirus FP protein
MSCSKCELVLSIGDADFCICQACEKRFHLTKACAGVTKVSFKSQDFKDTWKCAKCKEKRSGQNTPTGDTNTPFSFGEVFNEFKEEMRDSFKALQEELQKLRQDFTQEVKTLKDTVVVLKQQCEEKEIIITNLITQVNVQDQYSRNKNIELSNVEELDRENLEEIVMEIAKQLDVDIEERDIDAVHRLPTKIKKGSDKIIVQFTSRKKRDSFLEKRKLLLKSSDVTGGQRDLRIYINENLSPYYRELLWRAKQKAKDKGFKFVWVKNGRILTRRNELSKRVFRIDSIKDLDLFDNSDE